MAKGKRRCRTTWLASLVGIAVLVVAGFTVGVIAGVVSEEPELVMGHLMGRGETVAWSRAVGDQPGAAGSLPAVSAPRPDGGFSVQVGAFDERGGAAAVAEQLAAKGFPAYVTESDERWKVRVGPMESREDADALAGRLEREQGLPTWVLAEQGQ